MSRRAFYVFLAALVFALTTSLSARASLCETRVKAFSATDAICIYRISLLDEELHLGNSARVYETAVDSGKYRYSAFGKLYASNTATPSPVVESLVKWKGRPRIDFVPGLYDMRARTWSTETGTFFPMDRLVYHDRNSTLWGWPGMNPVRWSDPSGRDGGATAFGVGYVASGLGGAAAAGFALTAAAIAIPIAAGLIIANDIYAYNNPEVTYGPMGPPMPAGAENPVHEPIQAIATPGEYDKIYDEARKREPKERGEHTNSARPSSEPKHEKGLSRKNRDNKGEKGDKRRPYQRQIPLDWDDEDEDKEKDACNN